LIDSFGGRGWGGVGGCVGVSLRGRPGRRVGAGVGWFAWFACGAPVGAAAAAMAALTRGRHKVRLSEPGGQPLGLRSLMLKSGVGGTGGRRFRRAHGVGEDIVIGMGEEVAEATSSVEWRVLGAGIDSLFDSAGRLVTLPGEVGDVLRAEVVVGDPGMLSDGGCIVIGQGEFCFVMMLFEAYTHGSFSLAHICS
jgi:hypothetical protein